MSDMELHIWNSMLDAEYNVKLKYRVGKRYSRYDIVTKIFLGIMTSSSFITLSFWGYIPYILEALIGISVILSIAIPILNYQNTIGILKTQAYKWELIAFKYNRLWEIVDDENNNNLQKKYNEIKNEELELIKEEHVEFNITHRDKEKNICQAEVLRSRGLEV